MTAVMIDRWQHAKLLLCLFREEQSGHGNKGCLCDLCVVDMEIALKKFEKEKAKL